MPQADDTPALLSPAVAARLEEAIDRFEEAWQSGARPAIDDHLSGEDGGRAALLVELVHVDLEYRLKAGEPARAEEYLARYPELGRDRGVVIDLLAAEWKLRRRADPSVGVEEYARRFPAYRDDLMASATVSLLPRGALPLAPIPDPVERPEAEAATRSRYRILRLHARGGLGEILTAQDEDLHREVALKRLQPRLAHAAESRGRFLREAEITSQLEHPGVVPVYGLGQAADGSPVYAMRFIRGETFQEAVDHFHQADHSRPIAPRLAGDSRSESPTIPRRGAAERRLAFRQLLGRFVSVCNTVAYAHSRGFLHRDLKPGNILLGSYGETLVVDWGLAKLASAHEAGRAPGAEPPTATDSGDWTQAGEVIGTPAFMSPEQADGRWDRVGPASDVYSLGATLYVLLTGKPPFGPGLVGEVLDGVRRGVFARPRVVRKDVCPALEAVCLKAMAARPEQRYAGALALAADLERWLAGEPVAARREPIAARVRRWAARHATLAATGAVALAAGAVVAVVTSLWFAAAAEERSAKKVADVQAGELDRANRERYLFHVAAADREWRAFHFSEAAQHLAACDVAGLHGWEWNYLTRRSRDSDSLLTLKGHDKEVWNVAFSPDGKTLASASLDGTVRVWDAGDGRLLLKLEGHTGPVWGLAFSPDGALLATGGDETVQLWDAKTGKPLRTFDGLGGEVHGVDFRPDGKVLAAAVYGRTVHRDPSRAGGAIRLWDLPGGAERDPLHVAEGSPTSVAFSADGATVAAGTLDARVRRWNVAARKELEPLTGQQGPVRAVAFSRDGSWVASADYDGSLAIWDARTGALKHLLYGHTAPAWGVAFSPDGTRVATSADDAAVKVWDPVLGRLLFTLHGHTAGIANVAFSPDGGRLASASDDQTVRVWDAHDPGTAKVLCGHKHSVWGVAISPDGRLMASAGADPAERGEGDEGVRVWDAAGKEFRTLPVAGGARGVAFGALGRFLAAAGGDGTVRVWDVISGWEEHVLRGHDAKVLAVAFSPDGRTLASASADHTVKLWDVATWTEVRTLRGHSHDVRSAAFSPDGKLLATGGGDKVVKVWDAATGGELQSLTGCPAAVYCVTFSPDGQRLAASTAASEKVVTSDSGEIVVWDLETGQSALTLRGHLDDVRALAYSPDGSRLVSAGSDCRINFWDAATGQLVLTLYVAHLQCINAVAFSPDGGRLASASCDGTVILWDGTPPDAAVR